MMVKKGAPKESGKTSKAPAKKTGLKAKDAGKPSKAPVAKTGIKGKVAEKDRYRPLLLKFTPDEADENRLDRVMLDELAKHFGWSATQTIHVALERMFYGTFPDRIDDGPIPSWLLAQSKPTATLMEEATPGTVMFTLWDYLDRAKGATEEDVVKAAYKRAGFAPGFKPLKPEVEAKSATVVKPKKRANKTISQR